MPSPADPPSVRARLQLATNDDHRRLDRLVSTEHLLASVDGYGRLLLALAAARQAVFASIGGRGPSAEWVALARADDDALAADLATLGRPPVAHDVVAPDGVSTHPHAWGALYVLEGSRLGGPVLAARARRLGVVPTSYLARDGSAVRRRRWARACASLDERVADAGDAVVGARAVFRTVGITMGALLAPRAAPPDPVASRAG